jgi:geranylgeranyl reductase family protein
VPFYHGTLLPGTSTASLRSGGAAYDRGVAEGEKKSIARTPAPAKRASKVTKEATTKAAAKKVPAKKAVAKKAVAEKVPAGATPPKPAAAPRRRAVDPIHDVLVIGGGPGGSSCAYWLADAGWDVVVVEKKQFPREKTCGDGLTPRAVRQLADMDLEGALSDAHRYGGLRAVGFGQSLEMQWPDHPAFPSYGYTITRHDLDGLVCERAEKAGATVFQGTEAVAPLAMQPAPEVNAQSELAGCEGAVVMDKSGERREIRARYVVVADGSNSRFGRTLGASRARSYPLGMALRGYYRSERHDDPFIESHLDIRDASGSVVPGYGWIFPLGDGRVNVGVGLLSTDKRWKGINTSHLMDAFVDWAPKSWGISPETACGPATGGKLPMGLAVGPPTGANTVVIGDAGGSINPFNGEGIAYAYETGRLAAASLGAALLGDPDAVANYGQSLQDAYGPYYKVARAFVQVISNPQVMQLCVGMGLRSEFLMTQLLRIMANLMRPDTLGAAEIGYRGLEWIARHYPDTHGALDDLLAD